MQVNEPLVIFAVPPGRWGDGSSHSRAKMGDDIFGTRIFLALLAFNYCIHYFKLTVIQMRLTHKIDFQWLVLLCTFRIELF